MLQLQRLLSIGFFSVLPKLMLFLHTIEQDHAFHGHHINKMTPEALGSSSFNSANDLNLYSNERILHLLACHSSDIHLAKILKTSIC